MKAVWVIEQKSDWSEGKWIKIRAYLYKREAEWELRQVDDKYSKDVVHRIVKYVPQKL